MPPPHRSFLVTSLGAYDDSGQGTGGLTCVHEGAAVILDKIDSTALFRDGDRIYRFARGLQSLVGYDAAGVCSWMRLSAAKDVHDVLLLDGQFVCVSTGTNEVVWFDAFGRVTRRWSGAGEGDAWHLNCLCEKNGRLFIAAFGRFATHRGWVGNCTGTGFITDLETGEDAVTNLNGPHNPRRLDDAWAVCDSHAQALVIEPVSAPRRTVQLAGFTRGLAHDAHYFYVGESANRKADILSDHSFIAVIDRVNLEVVERIRIPFPEIYELILLTPSEAQQMVENPERFQVERSSERIRELENQVELGLRQIEELRSGIHDVSTYIELKAQLTKIKRRLVG